jgi:signal peptidase II
MSFAAKLRSYSFDRWALAAALFVVVLDQATKAFMLSWLQEGESVPVIAGLFHLTLHFNFGAAFGIFSELGEGTRQLVLAVAKAIALGAVLYFLVQEEFRSRRAQIALFLVMGGALGNIIDRVRLGKVVDFFDFYLVDRAYTWPTFNVADSAICIGVAMLLLLPSNRRAQ